MCLFTRTETVAHELQEHREEKDHQPTKELNRQKHPSVLLAATLVCL